MKLKIHKTHPKLYYTRPLDVYYQGRNLHVICALFNAIIFNARKRVYKTKKAGK